MPVPGTSSEAQTRPHMAAAAIRRYVPEGVRPVRGASWSSSAVQVAVEELHDVDASGGTQQR